MTASDTNWNQPSSLPLRVAEALPRDVGRGIVRLDPGDLRRLRADVGDIVEIVARSSTVARVTPAYPDQRGRSLIQLDGIMRANAGASLDEQVTVRRVAVQPARSIILSPVESLRTPPGAAESAYLARLLDGIPVVTGDQVRATLVGTRSQTFSVQETVPTGPVLISSTTAIRFAATSGEREPGALTYEDIGGLRREVRRVRELIELPLRHPEIFERLGIDPPRGVLLHGPPGSGKTLIARAVAHETSAYFVHVNGPEIIDQWYGASEGRLRKIFEDARRRAPAIIFIDEIDAIAPKREDLGGERQVERRVVAQLLTLMDGLESRGNVVVIGATNIPNALDPALRRPGRFDREISISVPDKDGRMAILEIHTRGMPLAEDVDLPALASTTHGFVGADLEALCREAAMSALTRLLPEGVVAQPPMSYAGLLALEVTADDFTSALREVGPSALREVFAETPDVGWDDVGGLDDAKQLLTEAVEWPLRHAALFEQAGVRPLKGILLHGSPGTGKTLLAKALAHESEADFISVKGPQLLSTWVGEGERALREVFAKARQLAPCIIFFDEIDALAPPRGAPGTESTERMVGQLLTELDGIEDLRGVVVLAATNRPELIDSALLRPGRFDVSLELPPPDYAARLTILRVHTRRMPITSDVDLPHLARETSKYTGADIEGLCRRAALLAIRDLVAQGSSLPDMALLKVNAQHFKSALAEMKKDD